MRPKALFTPVYFAFIVLILFTGQHLHAQVDTSFFPDFVPYSPNPQIKYGDGFFGAAWNDPCVLKNNNQYFMYASAVEGLANADTTISIYRLSSSDGYSWSLNPTQPVLTSDTGTYYQGGVETPSVVFFNGQYHQYNTVYTQNIPTEFKISHATSTDGIQWQMDANPVLQPDANQSWMSEVVAEPGAVVRNDTLWLFFTAVAFNGKQTIGLARSTDGSAFFDTLQVVELPTDVYTTPDYRGLSTPSATWVGDTLYLFTDVAQTTLNDWTQVALHQFKSFGDPTKWYHDDQPIHTRADFTWTNGNYFSEIRSITPLLDGSRLRIWYAGNTLGNIDTVLNDTTVNVYFVDGNLHVDSAFWGIGTSEYTFPMTTAVAPELLPEAKVEVNWRNGALEVTGDWGEQAHFKVFSSAGQLLADHHHHHQSKIFLQYRGWMLVQLLSAENNQTVRVLAY